jgi:hypothetical protein
MNTKQAVIVTFLSSAMAAVGAMSATPSQAQTSDAAPAAIAKRIGAIKTINGNTIMLAPEGAAEIAVTVEPNARILRLVPGEKDLKSATPLSLQDLQVGDNVRVRGHASEDGKSIRALEVVVITHSAVAAVSDQIRQDWQKRGIVGPVSATDPAAGTVTIAAGNKAVVIRTSRSTVIRRYAPDSAKPEDAKLSTLQEVRVGDQLRARGNRSADGGELAAEEVFTGNFPYVAGLIKSVDASAGTVSVQDVLTKKTVQLKINADSQLHKIPAEMAQRFAMRIKATLPPGAPGAAANSSSGSSSSAAANGSGGNGHAASSGASSGGAAQAGGTPGGVAGGTRSGGAFDFQRLLDQTPALALADLHKEDAVVILATEGTPSGGSTVIKLVSGVEPILQAAPSASQIMMLTPWTLGGAPGGDAGTP